MNFRRGSVKKRTRSQENKETDSMSVSFREGGNMTDVSQVRLEQVEEGRRQVREGSKSLTVILRDLKASPSVTG